MKKICLVLLMAVSIVSLSQAQDSSVTHKKHASTKANWATQLDLTKDQQDKIKASKQELKTKSDAIKADKSLTEEQKKAQLKEARKESKASVESVYTPEQKAKVKELKAQKKANPSPKKKAAPKTAPAVKG